MRRVVVCILVLTFVVGMGVVPAFAQRGQKGPSARAVERASDEAVFHRIGDWFATRGKSEDEKKAMLAERKTKRAAERAQKEAEKKKREMEGEAKKAQKQVKAKAEKMKKGLRR